MCGYDLRRKTILLRSSWRDQSRGSADGALQFCPSQQISKIGLKKIRFRLEVRGRGVAHIRNQSGALCSLIGRETFALGAELGHLSGDIDHTSGPLKLVEATFNVNGYLFFQALKV